MLVSSIGEWKSGSQLLSLYRSAPGQFSASIQDQRGTKIEIDSEHIKCGILGKLPHHLLIQKIDQWAQESIKENVAVCCYPSQGQPTEVWVFEAMKDAVSWIQEAKENLKQAVSEKEEKAIECHQKAIKYFGKALKIQKNQKGNTEELTSAISQIKKDLFLQQIKRDLPRYLSSAPERETLNQIEDAANYLLKATNSQERKQASELAERLGSLSLGLKHAAGYIRSSKMSIREYIQKFDEFQSKLLANEKLNLLTKEEKIILTTLNISLDAIETVHNCPLAKEVIAFFALLSEAPIPLDLVKDWFKTAHPTHEDRELLDTLDHLCGYSMIDSPSPDFYQVHPIEQKVIQHQMTNSKIVFEQAFKALNSQLVKFQQDSMNTWNLTNIPHALSLLKKEEELANINLKKRYEFIVYLGDMCGDVDLYQTALEIFRNGFKVAKRWHRRHPIREASVALTDCYHQIGYYLKKLERYKEALDSFQKGLKAALKTYGEKHSDVAETYQNIGSILYKQEEYDEAVDNLQKALEIWREVRGEKHSDVAGTYQDIGSILYKQEEYDEALNNFQKALEIWREMHEEKRAIVACTYIGTILQIQGKNDEALVHYQRALEILREVHGEDHLDVATSYNNVGSALEKMGRYKEALEYHKKALTIRLKVLHGNKNQDVAEDYSRMSFCLFQIENYDEALEYSHKGLEVLRELHGEIHSDVGTAYYNIGFSLQSLKRYDEALDFLKKSLDVFQKVYGERHLNVAQKYEYIGSYLKSLGRYKEAVEYCLKAFQIYGELYPSGHSELLNAKLLLNAVLDDAGQHQLRTILDKYDANSKEQAFRRAAYGSNFEDMQYLLEKEKVDINSRDPKQKKTALHWAVINNNPAVIRWLRGHGAKADIADAENKMPKDYDQKGLMK